MEEHFKNKLKNHKVDWDKEELLGDIQKGLSQNQSRFDKRWLLLLPFLFISTCWGLIKVNSSPDRGVAVENVISSDLKNSKVNTIDSSVVDFNKTEKQIIPSQLSNHSSEKNQPRKLDRSLSKINSAFRNIDTDALTNSKKSMSGEGPSENPTSTTRSNTTAALPKKPNSITPNTESQNKIIHTEQLPLLGIAALVFEKEFPPKLIVPLIANVDPEQIFDVKSYFFSSVIGNVGLINRSITASNNGQDNTENLRQNEETINSRLLLSTDFMVGYQHQSGWSLESGLGFNRIVESFIFEDTISLKIENIEYEKAFYFLTQNDTIFYSDSVTITNADIRKVRHNNYHSYFNIPLIVGFRYSLGKANTFGSLGISYAFAHTFKGRESQLLEGGEKVVVDNPTFDLKNRIGLNINIGIEYPLSNRTHIFTKMAYQRSPKLSRDVIDQIYHSYSLGIGLKVIID